MCVGYVLSVTQKARLSASVVRSSSRNGSIRTYDLRTSDPSTNTFFFLNDPATPKIYPLPLHDALPISQLPTRREVAERRIGVVDVRRQVDVEGSAGPELVLCSRRARHAESRQQHDECDSEFLGPHSPDRKSTRLNSSHLVISYAVFCLK